MSKKLQKTISVFTSITTIVWLSGVAMLVPISVGATTIVDGDLIRNPSAAGLAQFDIYIVKLVGDKKFKRLILNPEVFESYGHLDKNGDGDKGWNDVQDTDQATMDAYTTSNLVRVINDTKVYKLTADGDTGTKQWLNMTADEFVSEEYDADSIYTINSTDGGNYTGGSDVTVGGDEAAGTGTLAVTLAADTPAAGIAVKNAARVSFTKINLTASGGDVTIDSLVVERTGGAAQDGSFAGIDVIDGDTNLPINLTSKTFNSLHQASFNDDIKIESGKTKSITIAGNMASSLTNYAGEVPSLTLASMKLKGEATLNATLPITGNSMTINSTITIGSATFQRGSYTNASSTSIQVGKTDYTFFSLQLQAGSVEKVQLSQIKVYQEGSAGLGTDLINLELLQDTTKIADGVVQSGAKYVNFSFDPITVDKGKIIQFQVRADVDSGSARTVKLGIYKNTDILVKGLTYNYNITPTYSGTGAGGSSPYLSDNEFTISNGTMTVTRSNAVGATNIAVANDQYLGAFEFEVKGETIDVTALTLTITSSTGSAVGTSALLGVELVDPNGNVVMGPTDPTSQGTSVAWTDTHTFPVGKNIYKVRGDLQTSASWDSDNTVYVSFTPSAMTARGVTTGNTITPSPSSSVSGNTQTVKAGSLTVTRNTIPADANIIVNQKKVVLSSWSFDASASGEDIRVTSVLWAGRGQSATNTDALTMFIDENKNGAWDDTDDVLSPVSDNITSQPATTTFALDKAIIIKKGTATHVALRGDKDSISSNATENWGLNDSTLSMVTYGVSTGNQVAETLTADHGPTLTSAVNGTLTIETKSNPDSVIMVAGSTGNVFTNVQLTAQDEQLDLDQIIVYVTDGSYAFSAAAGNYQDVTKVSLYVGTTKLGEAAIPSTGKYTFDFDKGTLLIEKGATKAKTIIVKADMSTVDPNTDNAPGTNSADLKIGLGGENSVKTTGKQSNTEITGSSYETYRSSTSSAMVLRTSKPTVTLPTSSNTLGAATSLSNGNVPIFAFKVTADASGGDVLLYRTTFVVASSGSGMTITNVRIDDQNGNTIKAAANPTAYGMDAGEEYYYTATFNNPDFAVDDTTESISVSAGESRTFTVYATMAGVSTGENVTTFLVGDFATTSSHVNTDNDAKNFYPAPTGDLATVRSNFVWSDNYKQKSISGEAGNNATTAKQWYNGHLVPGLGNKVSTTPYVIGM